MAMYVQSSQDDPSSVQEQQSNNQLHEKPSVQSSEKSESHSSEPESKQPIKKSEDNVDEESKKPVDKFKTQIEEFKEYLLSVQKFINNKKRFFLNEIVYEVTAYQVQGLLEGVENILENLNNATFVSGGSYSYASFKECVSIAIEHFRCKINTEIPQVDTFASELKNFSSDKALYDDKMSKSISIINKTVREYAFLKKFSNIAQEVPQVYNLFQMFKIIPNNEDDDFDFRKKKDAIVWECICNQSRLHKVQK